MKVIKKVLIIEDEEVNAQRLQRLLAKIRPEYEVLGILDSIGKTIAWLSHGEPLDLIFMDIRLADGISFEIFNLTEIKYPVIFTTAYDEYAVKAFKYNSIDYLLKPIEEEELETAVIKFESLLQQSFEQHLLIRNLLDYIDKREYREKFLLPYRDGYKKVDVEDIAFFYSQDGTCVATLFNGESNVIPKTLETLEQQLNPKYFFRANRQYIVHIRAIEKVHNYFNSKIKLDVKQSKEGIIVSRLKATLLKEWLDY
ncbi:response regulator transcription factor [Olivibacter sp. SDN3]|uniref:LytR/AlgR family response regulator transcription factor n=1 Tax=Olivibacter sp. SDN3 TaxID=2764720 RepID=UPI0016517A19|nr:LytTR family DNA-binding domain-containing protein [Olivibacter sp. SDN3]QNL51881.1 response regulator transcription factor [Olivibacter sp. SDN3]